MIEDGKLTEEARELIDIGKELEEEGYELSIGAGTRRKVNKELVKRLIQARKNVSSKRAKEAEFLNRIFKKILKKILTPKEKLKSKASAKSEYGIASKAYLEKELARAIVALKSTNSIDSDANDLRILEDMAKITMLVSALSGKGSRNIDLARQSINNYSLTTGGASLEGVVARQALKINEESIGQSLRYHLDHQTASVDVSSIPITKEAKLRKDIENKKYADSVQALRDKESR